MLGGNLPGGGGADQDLVLFLGDRLTRVRRQPLAALKPPDQGMRIEQELQSSLLPSGQFGFGQGIEEGIVEMNSAGKSPELALDLGPAADEPRDRFAVPGDDDFLSPFDLGEQARQLGLRLMHVHYRHSIPLRTVRVFS